jgi:hypothetical protein
MDKNKEDDNKENKVGEAELFVGENSSQSEGRDASGGEKMN